MKPTENIFANNASAYHSHGIPVIPLYAREKKPCVPNWSVFAETPVKDDIMDNWINAFPTGNIGLVLGPVSGLIMIDIDTEDSKVFNAIMNVLPPSPWHRFGKKGMMLAYKWSPIKTCRIRNLSGETIVEILSSRTQCVIPPSIHPDTGAAYRANSNLLEVMNQLGSLPDDIENKLRQAIKAAGVQLSLSGSSKVTEYVAPGSRDTSLTEMAGLFAYAVVRGERKLKEAIGMLRAYHAEFIENTTGDIIPVDKHIENLLRFLHRDVLEKGKILPMGWDYGYTQEELEAMGVTLTSEDTEWDFETILAFLQEQFEEHPEGKPRADAVERIIQKVAKSNQLTKIDVERILRYISDVSGLGISIATLRGRLKELKTGDVTGNDHSEIARAVVKDLEMVGEFRHHHDRFMKWTGSHWEKFDTNLIKIHISIHYGHLAACRKNGDINGILNIVSYLLPSDIQTIDVRGVNFANGFLTQEMKLMPHNPDYGMTYVLPYRYMPNESGRFPMFEEFIRRCWGSDKDFQQKVDALQEALCVTLFGMGSRFQRAILLHGAPMSGKTQILRIVESIVPDNARSSVPPDQWDDKFLPAQMSGKILNVCGELSEIKHINGQKFKDIIDGSEMPAQHKNQQIFSFKPTLTHWFASNHLPKSRDTSRGFIRRWLFLSFHYSVKPEDRKLDIGEQIAGEEREAIVAWATQAMARLLVNNDYTLPESHEYLSGELANTNNSVRFFLKESGNVRFGEGIGYSNEVNLYNSYFGFCLGAGGVKPVGVSVFRAMLRELASEFGFHLNITKGRMGSKEARYEGLSVVA